MNDPDRAGPKASVPGRRAFLTMGTGGLVAVGAALSGCGWSGREAHRSSTLKVQNWGSADEARVYEDAFRAFRAGRPGLRVAADTVPVTEWGDYVSKLAIKMASDQSPDLLNIGMEGTRLAIERDMLVPLDDRVRESPAREVVEGLPAPLLEAFTVDGQLFAVPNGWQTMVIYCNTEIFEQRNEPLPDDDWTWDDFLATAQRLTGSGVVGFGLPWGFFQLHPWWLTNGGSVVTADNKRPSLTDPRVVEAVTFVRDLVRVHEVAPDPTSVDVYAQFASGRFAMVGAGRWPLGGWSDAGFTSYVPRRWPARESHTTVVGGAGWAISREAVRPDIAWEAVEHLSGDATVRAVSEVSQQIPVEPVPGVGDGDPAVAEALDFLFTRLDDSRPVAAPAFYDRLESTTMRYLQRIMGGEMSPEAGLAAANEEIEEALP